MLFENAYVMEYTDTKYEHCMLYKPNVTGQAM